MTDKDIGFTAKKEAEVSDKKDSKFLEGLIEPSKDPYAFYRGQYIEASAGRGVEIIGVYRGIRDVHGVSEMVFSPFLLNKAREQKEEPNRKVGYYELSDNFSFLNLNAVVLVTPYDKEYILGRIEASREVAGIKSSEKVTDIDLRL